MRTSGATTETSMTIVVIVIAFTLLVFFAGGPREFLLAVQRTVAWVGSLVFATYQQLRA
jgi:hypothetical protein